MSRSRPGLAKLTRPRLRGAVARERLFKLIDDARERPVIWIAGPPGAGKTTLVASYLDARKTPSIWYQMDSADSDPATFFYYLRQPVNSIRVAAAKPLLLLTPAYLQDLLGFSRRFFRDLFDRLTDKFVLVFDNFQEVATDSAVQNVIESVIEEIPNGANLLLVSREGPPPRFARAIANGLVATLGWAQLRLTREETQAIVLARTSLDSAAIEALHQRSNGWAAGVTLMLERLRQDGVASKIDSGEAMETVFNYFAGQIIDTASPEVRELLFKTAVFPHVTAEIAESITGNRAAGRLLNSLHRRHLFIERRLGGEVTYQYHTLFRAFLKHRAAEQFSGNEWTVSLLRAANLLEARGHCEEAFALHCEAGNWEKATVILIEAAPKLIGQGRLQTVQGWVRALCDDQGMRNPWVGYWLAMATEPVKPGEARTVFEEVFKAFQKSGDEIGQMMSAAGILDTIFADYGDFVEMDSWIRVVTESLTRDPIFPSPEAELRAYSALLVAASIRQPGHPMLKACAKHVARLIAAPFNVNVKIVAATRLSAYVNMSTDFELERVVAAEVEPLLESPDLAPPHAAAYLNISAYNQYLLGRYTEALGRYDRAFSIAQAEGLDQVKFWILLLRAACERRAGRLIAAERTFGELETLPKPQHGVMAAMYQIVKALMALSRREFQIAVEEGLASQRLMEASGSVSHRALQCAHNVLILIAAGDFDRAMTYLEQARALVTGTSMNDLLGAIALNEAHVAHLRGDAHRRDERLKEALQFARQEGGSARLRWYPDAMSVLFPVALREGIEPGIVRSLIRKFKIEPHPIGVEDWPWPVKIFTLGRFEVIREGVSLRFEHKAPRKQLALLKAIIAHGGQSVPLTSLIDDLWTGEEGDAASEACKVTLHRLRKLLGDLGAIRIEDGKVSLESHCVWVDAFAFERMADHGADPLRMETLYQGQFLPEEREASWVLSPRERLRGKFVRHVSVEGHRLEQVCQFRAAAQLYQRGIDADDLAEGLYQGLMRCYAHLKCNAEGMAVYRRLRQILSVTLGISPSADSETLFRALQRTQTRPTRHTYE